MNLPVEILESVNKGNCILFVGPTYSMEAAAELGRTYPDGRSLAKSLGWKKPRRMEPHRQRKKRRSFNICFQPDVPTFVYFCIDSSQLCSILR